MREDNRVQPSSLFYTSRYRVQSRGVDKWAVYDRNDDQLLSVEDTCDAAVAEMKRRIDQDAGEDLRNVMERSDQVPLHGASS